MTFVLGLAPLILVATVATLLSSALTILCCTSFNFEALLGHLGASINTEQCVQYVWLNRSTSTISCWQHCPYMYSVLARSILFLFPFLLLPFFSVSFPFLSCPFHSCPVFNAARVYNAVRVYDVLY